MNTQEKQKETSSRSVILLIEETKNQIVQEVNGAIRKGIPCYLLKDALEGILSQIREGAKAEIEAARAKEADRAESENKEENE